MHGPRFTHCLQRFPKCGARQCRFSHLPAMPSHETPCCNSIDFKNGVWQTNPDTNTIVDWLLFPANPVYTRLVYGYCHWTMVSYGHCYLRETASALPVPTITTVQG